MAFSSILRKPVISWCLYDWANSAFALTVMAGFFPGFFKAFLCTGVDVNVSTARLMFGSSIAGLIIAVLSPFLGAMAGAGRSKKRFLAGFMLVGTSMTAGIALVGRGQWLAGLCLYAAANIGYTLANLFYDSLLVDVADRGELDMVSSWGFGLGYIGSSFLFVLNMVMYLHPERFGIPSPAVAIRISFVLVALWWLVFSFPVLAIVKQRGEPAARTPVLSLMAGAIKRLGGTARHLARDRNLLLFLIAYWIYIDGINTVIVAATDFGLSLGLKLSFLMVALLVVQMVAFPASIGFGVLARRIGAKRSIVTGLGVYLFIAIAGAWFMHSERDFMVLAVLIGMAQGGVQALSRSLFACMVPAEASADFFGVYNLVGKFAVVGGPAAVGATNLVLHALHQPAEIATRAGISVLAVLFLFGGGLLLFVKQPVQEK